MAPQMGGDEKSEEFFIFGPEFMRFLGLASVYTYRGEPHCG